MKRRRKSNDGKNEDIGRNGRWDKHRMEMERWKGGWVEGQDKTSKKMRTKMEMERKSENEHGVRGKIVDERGHKKTRGK